MPETGIRLRPAADHRMIALATPGDHDGRQRGTGSAARSGGHRMTIVRSRTPRRPVPFVGLVSALSGLVFAAMLAGCGSNSVQAGESGGSAPPPADGNGSSTASPSPGTTAGSPDTSGQNGTSGAPGDTGGSTGTDSNGGDTTGGSTTGGNTTAGPRIVWFRITQRPQCSQGTDVYSSPAVPLRIAWQTSGATGVALSVDNPGLVGSYGSYGPSGSQEFTFGCGGSAGSTESHTYEIYTISSAGTRKHASLTASVTVPDRSTVTKPSGRPPA
jgi:hypothetical protein